MANLQRFSNFIPIAKRFQELTTKNHSKNLKPLTSRVIGIG